MDKRLSGSDVPAALSISRYCDLLTKRAAILTGNASNKQIRMANRYLDTLNTKMKKDI